MPPDIPTDTAATWSRIGVAPMIGEPSCEERGRLRFFAFYVGNGTLFLPRAPGEDELKQLVRARLRSSRVPEKIAFVTELPYNEMGKLLRREVKKILAD